MNNKKLEEIKARCIAATPGPWEHVTHDEYYGQGYGEVTHFVKQGENLLRIGLGCDQKQYFRYCNDALFIAHAREDIPYLLNEINRLQKIVEKMI